MWLLLSEVIVNKGIDVRDPFLPNSPLIVLSETGASGKISNNFKVDED